MTNYNNDAKKLAGMENDPDDRLSHCEYMLYVTHIPVCFWVDKDGGRYGASVPGKEKGSLVPDATYLSKYFSDTDEFSPIDQNEFEQRVKDYESRGHIDVPSTYAEEIYQQYLAKNQGNKKG